jgi:hypothetical protein
VGLPVADTVTWERRLADMADDPTVAGRATWALALARLADGDTAGARHWAERLSAGAPLRVLIDAGRAAAAGDFALALRRTDSVRVKFTATQPPDPFSSTVFHLLRGKWLVASGDSGRAQREWMWHEASDIEGWPVGLSRAAEVSAAFGAFARLGRGCRQLERVEELWSQADSTMRSLLIKAARSRECHG